MRFMVMVKADKASEDTEVEIRQVFEADDFGAESTPATPARTLQKRQTGRA